jgi:hypothetical protein
MEQWTRVHCAGKRSEKCRSWIVGSEQTGLMLGWEELWIIVRQEKIA